MSGSMCSGGSTNLKLSRDGDFVLPFGSGVYDVSDPCSPQVIISLPEGQGTIGTGGRIITSHYDGTHLTSWNLGDPEFSFAGPSWELPGDSSLIREIKATGDTVAVSYNSGLNDGAERIALYANPQSGTTPFSIINEPWPGADIRDFKVYAGRVYVVWDHGIRSYLASDGTMQGNWGDQTSRAMAVTTDHLFVADHSSLLTIYRSNDPGAVPVGKLQAGLYNEIIVTNDVLYCALDGIDVIDVSDPESPVLMTHLDTGRVVDIAVAGDRLYALSYFDLTILGLSNPLVPEVVSTTSVFYSNRVMPIGDHIVLTHYRGSTVYNVSDPGVVKSVGGLYQQSWNAAATSDDGVILGRSTTLTRMLLPCGVSVHNENTSGPESPDLFFRLDQPSPNPFNPSVRIRFTLERPSAIDLGIFDLSGHRVCTLSQGLHAAGSISLSWQGRDSGDRPVPAGVYIVRLQSEGRSASQMITLIK